MMIFIIFIFVIVLAGNSEPCPAMLVTLVEKVRRLGICAHPQCLTFF